MTRLGLLFFTFTCFLTTAALPANGQSSVAPSPTPTPASTTSASLEKDFIKHLARDQAHIWTSPFRKETYGPAWVLPTIGLTTAALIASDTHTSGWVSENGSLPKVSHVVSWGGRAYITGGTAAAFYLAGRATHNYKARETGILAAQSLINTGIVTEVIKLAAQRARPPAESGNGEFWEGGTSFPSGHASSIWSVATVIAYEYQNQPLIKYGAYAAAVAVSMSRYTGRNHFLSDIFVGSVIGFTIGRYTYKEYHQIDTDLPPPKPITKFVPQFVPYYGRGTYGGSLVWHL